MKALFLALALAMTSQIAHASECGDLKKELAAMQEAQVQIMNSLVSNHETFASSLEEYSEVVSDSKSASSSKVISKNMDQSAKAFRARGVQGKRMASRLEKATADLMARVDACLK